jgi:hypothetical protein
MLLQSPLIRLVAAMQSEIATLNQSILQKIKSKGGFRMAIKVITNRDRELFRQLARTAIITKQQAQQHLNYDRNNRKSGQRWLPQKTNDQRKDHLSLG